MKLTILKCISSRECISGSSYFSIMDIFLTFLSVGSFLADIGTDIIVIIQYYRNGQMMWMFLTTGLVCIPSLVVQIFSIRWYIADDSISKVIWCLHIFQLGIFQRYVNLLHLGLKVRKKHSDYDFIKFNQQQSDICMLRLFESFMESAPQLVLQMYIMVSTDDWNPWTGISALAAMVSMSWGISVYSKAMRCVRPEKKHLSWWGSLFQALWRIGMISSRIIAMVLFAVAYGSWLIFIMTVHWLCMTLWIFMQKTDFCSTWWEERLYNGVVGVVYCFCYFNVKEGSSRIHMTLFYLLTMLQNTCFLIAFYFSKKSIEGLKHLLIFFVPSGMVTGILGLLIYYRFFHPSGPIMLFSHSSENSKAKPLSNDEIVCNCCTLKTCRSLKEKSDNVRDHHILQSETNNQEGRESSSRLYTINTNTSLSISPRDNNESESRNLDASKLSLTSEVNISCLPDLHRSHSLNCSREIFGFRESRKTYDLTCFRMMHASHHRNVNYNFRPAPNFGLSRVHCSCLVLIDNPTEYCKRKPFYSVTKLSKSLPNLDADTDINIIEGNSLVNESETNSKNGSLTKSSTFENCNEPTNLPEIMPDCIIEVKV